MWCKWNIPVTWICTSSFSCCLAIFVITCAVPCNKEWNNSKSTILCWYVACVKECFRFFFPQICSYFGCFVDFFELPFSAYCCVWKSFITFRNNPFLLVCEIWKHKVFHWKKIIINECFFFRKIDLHQHSKRSKKKNVY